jgi:glycosyltransferase involved in cell wall biosynthesis
MRLLIVDEEIIAGGVETFRFNLIPELAKLCESVVWVLPQPIIETFRERIPTVQNLLFESLSWPRGSVPQLAAGALRRLSRWRLLENPGNRLSRQLIDSRSRALAQKHGSAACLVTCVIGQPPPACHLPLAAFVCDVNPALPEMVRSNITSWLTTADAIFGISQFTCDNLRGLAPGSAAKIHVVPMAAPPRLCPLGSPPKYQSDFYFPAATNSHKGHLVLFQACLALIRRGAAFRLILSGPGNDRFQRGRRFDAPGMEEARIFLEEHAEELNGSIVVAGEVSPAKVHAFYDSTKCVVLPSRYEGFGLPVAEALQYGRRIICSDIPPFREQLATYDASDYAQFVPPGDPLSLADAMERVLRGTDLPRSDSAELDRRMARWTWADVAGCCYNCLASIIQRN